MEKAVGYLEVLGYSVALNAMDKACKNADIQILGIDTTNPKDTKSNIPLSVQVKFQGELSSVKEALRIASDEAAKYIDQSAIITSVISRPAHGMEKINLISKVNIQEEPTCQH